MPYRHGSYSLYTREVSLNGGRLQRIYYFSAHPPKSGSPCDLPAGFAVEVSNRTGLPYLKKMEGWVPATAEVGRTGWFRRLFN